MPMAGLPHAFEPACHLPACLCCVPQEYEGYQLSVLGGCVVSEDGTGVWLKPQKMGLDQLRAELNYAGIEFDPSLKKTGLVRLIKVRLPARR